MASAAVLAWVRRAIVHVQFAILSLEAFVADALIRADKILAGRSILARGRLAFIDLLLAVRAGVTVETMASVRVPDVLASTVIAE